VGEFDVGGEPGKGDWNYWSNLIRFLGEVEASWGYWALNPLKPANNEFESYGLVMADWETVKEDFRVAHLQRFSLGQA